MAVTRKGKKGNRKATASTVKIEELLPPPKLMPGESTAYYEGLRDTLFADLNPGTGYQELLAEQIVQLVHDVARHRRLRDSLLVWQIRNQIIEMLDLRVVRESGVDLPYENSEELARDLASENADKREVALAVLKALDISSDEIAAIAYRAIADELDPHERWIVEAERRLRKLREDYDTLKILEASVVEDAQ